MADDATVKFGGDIKGVEEAIQGIEARMDSWATSTKALIAGAFALVSVDAILDAGSKLIEFANGQIEAETRLESVLKATGNTTGFTADELKQMASDLQGVTRFGDEATIGMQALLAGIGNLNGENFERTTRAAQDMATVLKGDLESTARQLGKALQSPVKGMRSLREAGITFSDSEKKVVEALVESGDTIAAQSILLDKLEGQFKGAASESAATFEGQVEQLSNKLGDVYEVLGFALIPVIESLLPVADTALDVIGRLAGAFGDTASEAEALASENQMVQWFTDILDWAVRTYTYIETFFTNFGLVVDTAATSSLLSMTSFFENLVFFLTDTVPTALAWFADNFTNIFVDIGSFVGTVVTNMFDNLVEFFTSVWDWLQGNESSFEFKGLTEGFESSLSELPEIARRQFTPFEKALQERLNENAQELVDGFGNRLKANREAVGLTEDGTAIAEAVEKADSAKKESKDLTKSIEKALDFAEKEEVTEKAESGFESLDSMLSRIQDSAASNGDSKRNADATEALVSLTKQANKDRKEQKPENGAVLK